MVTVKKFTPSFLEWGLMFFRDALWRALIPTILLGVVGFFVVPLLLFWAKERPLTNLSFGKQYEGWRNIQWPTTGIWKLFYIFSNAEVGGMGDEFWPGLAPKWALKLGLGNRFVMWYWLAIRNPIHSLKQIVGVTIDPDAIVSYCGDYEVGETASGALGVGWQFVKAETNDQKVYGLYIIHKWSDKAFLRLRMGYKLKPNVDLEAQATSQIKIATCCVPTPYKKIKAA
jgi:hypothetical protein